MNRNAKWIRSSLLVSVMVLGAAVVGLQVGIRQIQPQGAKAQTLHYLLVDDNPKPCPANC